MAKHKISGHVQGDRMIEVDTTASLLPLVATSDNGQGGTVAPSSVDVVESARVLMTFSKEQHDSLHRLDEALGGYLVFRREDRPAALAMRRLYEQWSAQADELLNRVRQLGFRSQLAVEFEALNDAVGRTQAMLSITLESLDRADEDFAAGRTCTIEELRRELRAAAGR